METIYRVALASDVHKGPYQCGCDFSNLIGMRHTSSRKYPCPFEDKIFNHVGYLFAFESKEAFRRWFSFTERVALDRHGFVLYEIVVSKIDKGKRGKKQVCFLPDDVVSMTVSNLHHKKKQDPCVITDMCKICELYHVEPDSVEVEETA